MPRFSRIVGWILALYWLAMFAGTHVPKPPEAAMGVGDKALHYSGYSGLTFLLAVWLVARRGPNLAGFVLAAAIATIYGAADEITQIPVGRDCEFNDWLADTAGAITGAALAAVACALWRMLRPRSADRSPNADHRVPPAD